MASRVYGPVPSRRYGLSLGVDLIPPKVCSYDCVYCQVGRTTEHTTERRCFYPPEAVLADVEQALAAGPRPDVITLAGSGDPSLYTPLGELIGELKRLSDAPVVLLTNGGLLWREDVLADALRADVLAPDLDAGDARTFARINRPHPDITFERMCQGLRRAIEEHSGQVRVEVMLVPGINDDPEAVTDISRVLRGLAPTAIDLNTPVRPVPGGRVRACPRERLEQARRLLGPRGRSVADYSGPRARAVSGGDVARSVLEVLARRPCTLEDLCASLGRHRNEVSKTLAGLEAEGRIEARAGSDGQSFYAASSSG